MANFNTIAASVKVVLDTIAAAPTTVIRKDDAFHPRDSEELPLCVISLGSERNQSWATMGNGTTDQGTIGKEYEIMISVYRSCLANLETDLATNPDFFDSAKDALNKGNLAGADFVWNTELHDNEAWEKLAFGEAKEVSRFILAVCSGELRNG